MSWFNKKNEDELEIPKLPELPDIPDFNFTNNLVQQGIPNLPEPEIKTLPFIPEFRPSNFQETERFVVPPFKDNSEINEITNNIIPRTREIQSFSGFNQFQAKKTEPLYIRLDKFQTTLESFKEIKKKIMEIEELLNRTREIKIKEEEELSEWENEIKGIKARIDFIDKNIFNKLE